MTEAEFDVWNAYSIGEYAKDKTQALGIDKAHALKLSAESYQSLLPIGRSTVDNHFFTIVRNDENVGWVWFALKTEWGVTSAFVYDVEIKPDFRRQGIAATAMVLMESEARACGAEKVALHVFGRNEGALDLYTKVGYHITDYSMAKSLT